VHGVIYRRRSVYVVTACDDVSRRRSTSIAIRLDQLQLHARMHTRVQPIPEGVGSADSVQVTICVQLEARPIRLPL
jgi:hypothetical protein